MDNDLKDLLARNAIFDLLNEYSNLVNRRDWTRLADVFTVDGVFEAFGTMTPRHASGREAVVTEISNAVGSFEMLIQTPYAPLIEKLSETQAEVVSFINELVSVNEERGFRLSGTCFDVIVREKDRWRLKHRRFTASYLHLAPLPGKIIR